MPNFDIVRKNSPTQSFRVKYVMGTYDLQSCNIEERFIGSIELPEEWNVGLIVGKSGTGKSTIAQELFGDKIVSKMQYTHDNILDDMPRNVSMADVCLALNSVGFSSPPSWLKPYQVLSNGEKMRCDIARAMLENDDMFVFDEFTSVVDRNVAKIGSFALQKAIRKNGKKFIAVTCHYDVEDWLMPDWVFCTDDMTFRTVDAETQKKNRPELRLDIFETKHKDRYWNIFKKYHYLSHSFNKASRVFVCTCNGDVCGFCAALPFPHPIKKNTWKEHRTVVLPDYQGVGIGRRFTNVVAELFASEGKHFISTTSNPAMIFARKNDDNWIVTRVGRMGNGSKNGVMQNSSKKGSTSNSRITVSFEYVVKKQAKNKRQ